MNLPAMVVTTAILGALTYFFYRKRRHALSLKCVTSFTKWLRLRHGAFLVLSLLLAVYLYVAPDSSGTMLIVWWVLLIFSIFIEAFQFGRTFSPRQMELVMQRELGNG